jgi:hypothetical protein
MHWKKWTMRYVQYEKFLVGVAQKEYECLTE